MLICILPFLIVTVIEITNSLLLSIPSINPNENMFYHTSGERNKTYHIDSSYSDLKLPHFTLKGVSFDISFGFSFLCKLNIKYHDN